MRTVENTIKAIIEKDVTVIKTVDPYNDEAYKVEFVGLNLKTKVFLYPFPLNDKWDFVVVEFYQDEEVSSSVALFEGQVNSYINHVISCDESSDLLENVEF